MMSKKKNKKVYLNMVNGCLALPANVSQNRFFTKDNLIFNAKRLSKRVGGNLISIKNHAYIQALDNINLNLTAGDRIGLIGHNGSGKTSLLKALARIYPLSSGEISSFGKISAFIAQGVGHNPESTAIDFLTYQCMLRGMNKLETNIVIKEVIEFIELGVFTDLPIRTYSSGMQARLFASSALFFPCEILLLDEGIGAGDQNFYDRFQTKLNNFFKKSKIMVLASHNKSLLETWCNKGLVLENGKVVFEGSISMCLDYYS